MMNNVYGFDDFCLITESKMHGAFTDKDRRKFREKLQHNIVVFKYIKLDNTIRRARGTLIKRYLPPIKGTGVEKPDYQFVYYDIEKKGWRSFRDFKFIKVISETPDKSEEAREKTKLRDVKSHAEIEKEKKEMEEKEKSKKPEKSEKSEKSEKKKIDIHKETKKPEPKKPDKDKDKKEKEE